MSKQLVNLAPGILFHLPLHQKENNSTLSMFTKCIRDLDFALMKKSRLFFVSLSTTFLVSWAGKLKKNAQA